MKNTHKTLIFLTFIKHTTVRIEGEKDAKKISLIGIHVGLVVAHSRNNFLPPRPAPRGNCHETASRVASCAGLDVDGSFEVLAYSEAELAAEAAKAKAAADAAVLRLEAEAAAEVAAEAPTRAAASAAARDDDQSSFASVPAAIPFAVGLSVAANVAAVVPPAPPSAGWIHPSFTGQNREVGGRVVMAARERA